MQRQDIDSKYLNQANQLEVEFFDIVNEGLPSQHRILRAGKSADEFNQRHGEIWQAHCDELIAEGFMEPRPEPEPVRDLATEIDEIKAEITAIKLKVEI